MTPKSFLPVLMSLLLNAAAAQELPFALAQAIAQEQVTFYDVEGYTIFQQEFPYRFDDKGFEKIKKKFTIPKDTQAEEDPDFPGVKIFNVRETKGGATSQSTYYVAQGALDKIAVVGFYTLCDRVKTLEKTYYDAIVSYSMPKEIFASMEVDTIQFAGRALDLGTACHWRGVRNLQCPNMGQMNWSEFSSLDRAKQMTEGQKALNASLKMGDLLEDVEVDIIFEGQPTRALRRTLKIKIPQLIMGGSNILIIYYVTAQVNNRYISCTLSHYTDDVNAKKLPPLLSEVMALRE